MQVNEELYWQIRAFLRTFEDDCKSCYREKTYCLSCRNARAVAIAKRMDAGNGIREVVIPEGQFKHVKLMAEIYGQLSVAQHPLRANEIRVTCSRSFKEWILKKMILLGRIERMKITDSLYQYSVKKEKTK